MESQEFINTFIIKQSQKLIDNKSYIAAVIVLTIGLEIMGGFFDKKPLKSPKQSKARFKTAIDKLLGGKYAAINRDNTLYELLRNQLIHSLVTGKRLQFSLNTNHLTELNGIIIFNPIIFFEDIKKAVEKLNDLLLNKKAFTKRITDSSLELSFFI